MGKFTLSASPMVQVDMTKAKDQRFSVRITCDQDQRMTVFCIAYGVDAAEAQLRAALICHAANKLETLTEYYNVEN